MPTYRLSYFYQSADDEGWSENFYFNAATIGAAQTELDALMPLLLGIRSNHFKIVDARVSDVATRGSTLFSTLSMPQVGTYIMAAGAVPLEANNALIVILKAVLPRFARWFLRGLASDIISGREKVAHAPWDTAFANLLSRLLSGSYQARHRVTPPPHATYSYSPISSGGIEMASARKPGRPFGLLVGRRVKPE